MRDLQKKGVPQVTKEKLHVASLMCFTFCCFYYRLTGCALEPPQQGCVIGLRQATVYHTGKCNFTLHTVHNHSHSQNDMCIRIYTFTDSHSQIHFHRFTSTFLHMLFHPPTPSYGNGAPWPWRCVSRSRRTLRPMVLYYYSFHGSLNIVSMVIYSI